MVYSTRSSSSILVSVMVLGLAVCCAKQEPDEQTGGRGGSSSIFSGAGGSGSISTNGTTIVDRDPDSCQPQPDDTGCVGAAYEGESVPLDILVMFDL